MKKIVSCFLAILMLTGTCVAAVAESAENVTITYWYWADEESHSQAIQANVAKFNAENGKGITVVAEQYPNNTGGFANNLFTAVMGGGGPDCSSLRLSAIPQFKANDLLVNLEDYVAAWDGKDEIPENIFKAMRYASQNDGLYVMPQAVVILYVYYRPSMFKEVGIEIPKTYDEFLEACAKLTRDTDGDGAIDVYGYGIRGAGGQEAWGSFIKGAGGSFEELNSEASIKGMQNFLDLYTNGYAPPSAPTDGGDQILTNMKSGLTAMTIHHPGSAKQISEILGDDLDAFAFPAGDGRWTSMGEYNNVILTQCQHPEAAFEWLTYLDSVEAQMSYGKASGNIPVNTIAQADEYFQTNKFFKASIDGMGFAGSLPIKDTTSEFIGEWSNTVSAALLGAMSAEEAMEHLQSLLNP